MHLLNLTTNSLQAYVAADCVALVRRVGRVRPRLESASEQVVPDESGAQPWDAALLALREMVLSG